MEKGNLVWCSTCQKLREYFIKSRQLDLNGGMFEDFICKKCNAAIATFGGQ